MSKKQHLEVQSDVPASYKLFGFAGDFSLDYQWTNVTAVFKGNDGSFYQAITDRHFKVLQFEPFGISSYARIFLPISEKAYGKCLVIYQASKFPDIRQNTFQVGDCICELPMILNRD